MATRARAAGAGARCRCRLIHQRHAEFLIAGGGVNADHGNGALVGRIHVAGIVKCKDSAVGVYDSRPPTLGVCRIGLPGHPVQFRDRSYQRCRVCGRNDQATLEVRHGLPRISPIQTGGPSGGAVAGDGLHRAVGVEGEDVGDAGGAGDGGDDAGDAGAVAGIRPDDGSGGQRRVGHGDIGGSAGRCRR